MIVMNEIAPEDLAASLVELGAAWWELHLATDLVRASPNCAKVLGLGDRIDVTAARVRAVRSFPARGWVALEAVHHGPDGRVRSRLVARTDGHGTITSVFGLEMPFSSVAPSTADRPDDLDADAHLLGDILEVQPAMVARYRPDSTVVWCNEAYAAHLGATPGGVRGRKWVDLAAEQGYDAVDSMEQLLDNILATTPVGTTSTVLAPMPGELGMRWIQWSNRLLPGADEGNDLVQAIGVEVTELRTARDALDAMARELVRSRVAERRELARRLHDDVVQVLVSAMWAMSPSDDVGIDADAAQRGADLVRMAIEQLRSCLGELTTPTVQPESVAVALEVELAPLRAAGIAVETTIDDVADEEVRTVATRVLTEAVRNVHRHAFATQVQVTLVVRGDTVEGRIIDNGIGARDDDLTLALAAGHVGLLMSRAMVESIGGTFSVRGTGRSEGTTVEFEVPLWPSRRGPKE